jgi:hypothetical protein
MDDVHRELRRLRRLIYVTVGIVSVFLLMALTRQGTRTRLTELDVERINVIEKDGKLRLVISNKARSPGPMHRGQPFGYAGGSRPGIILFSEEQTEVGGLVFDAKRETNGRYGAGAGFTFDQYDQDQTLALQYQDNNGRRFAGLSVADYPTDRSSKEFNDQWKAAEQIGDTAIRRRTLDSLDRFAAKPRLYAGRDRNASSRVVLYDVAGRPRLRLQVDSLGTASIDFLSDSGRVTRTIGASERPQ